MGALSTFLNGLSVYVVLGIFAAVMVALYFVFNAIPKTKPVKLQLLCVAGMDLITLLFFILTFSLRVSKMAAEAGATPRTMPRLWAFLMLFASIGAYVAILGKDAQNDKGFDRWAFALLIGVGSIFSVLMFKYIGYYLSSAIFIEVVMIAMKEKNKLQLIVTPIAWCLFTFLVFDKLLYIKLPIGMLFDMLF